MPWAQILLNIIFLLPGFLVKTVFFCKKGFGKAYLKGLGKGLSLGISKEGRKHKVRFHKTHLKNYIHIQKMLWQGLIHFLKENIFAFFPSLLDNVEFQIYMKNIHRKRERGAESQTVRFLCL